MIHICNEIHHSSIFTEISPEQFTVGLTALPGRAELHQASGHNKLEDVVLN